MARRTKIDKGIYRDAYGIAATVKTRGMQREKRFSADESIKTIKAWQIDTRSALQKLAPRSQRGTFAAEAEKYLKSVATMPTIKERRKHIAEWVAEFGQRARHTIKTVDVNIVLSKWLTAGKSASAVRNRRTALLSMFTKLDEKVQGAVNPVEGSLLPEMPEPTARALSYPLIETILAAMPDVGQGLPGKARDSASKTKARLRVIAYTGLPHKLLKALTRDMVDWQRGVVTVPARHKGHGVKRRPITLTVDGLEALEQFDALDCWGNFSNSSMLKSWRRACVAANVKPIPRVYDLRHSFATETYLRSGDPKATAYLLMHSEKSHMMDRYTLGGVQPRVLVAVEAFNTARGKKRLAQPAGSETDEKKQTA